MSESDPLREPRRRKAYLVATYTGQLDAQDARESWFVFDEDDLDHQKVVAELSEEERQSLRPVRQLPSGVAQTGDAELEERHARSQGWYTRTDPATTATVHVILKGTLGDSGQHTLSHARPSNGAGVFQAGSIDEFAISCEDLGDIHTLEVWHDNDGADLQESRWKLNKVVVTCIQSTGNKGDFAEKTKKTGDSDQWHFVLEDNWLGCTPTDKLSVVDDQLSAVDDELAQLGHKMELLQVELEKLRVAKRNILSAPQEQCEPKVVKIGGAAAPPVPVEPSRTVNPAVLCGAGVCLLLLVIFKLWPAPNDNATSVEPAPPPALPQCNSEMVDAEECDCELWTREEESPTLLGRLCASDWDESVRDGTWEAAEAHIRCKDCCTSTGFEGMPTGFGDSGNGSGGSSWIFFTLMVLLCAVLVATLCTCDALSGSVRRSQIDRQLQDGLQGAQRLIPRPRRGGTVARPRSPTRRGRSRSRSPGRSRSFASLSRDSRDSTYF